MEKYPKLYMGALQERGNLQVGNQKLDIFILKESGKFNRKWVLSLQRTEISPNAEEGKPRSFRSESYIQLRELIHILVKMLGAWEILGILSPFNDKKIKMEDMQSEYESRWASLSREMKSHFYNGFILGLEDKKVKVV